MNKQKFIKMIGERLSGRTEEDLEDFISDEADFMQRSTLEESADLPWFLSRTDEITLTQSGVLTLQEGFLYEDPDEGIQIVTERGTRDLKKIDLKTAYDYFRQSEVGTPSHYALFGVNGIRFFPKPDKEYLLLLSAYYRDVPFTELGADESNLWMTEGQGLLFNEVGRACAMILRDSEAVKFFSMEAEKAKNNLSRKSLERRYVNQHFTLGGR